MKKVNNQEFCFCSISSPSEFIERIKTEAVGAGFKVEERKKGFDLQFDSNHGGKIVYRANVFANENGGSFIEGKIITIPLNQISRSEKKSIIKKVLSVIGYIIILPFILLFLLVDGIYHLLERIIHGKEPSSEEKLFDFMINKMCCRKHNNQKELL